MYENLNKFCEDNWLQLSWSFEYGRYWDSKVSITELLSILVDPGFEYIKQNHAVKLQEACDRWTRIHENLEKGTDKQDPFYRRFREWKIVHGIDITYKEKTFYREEIRGMIDAWTNIWPVDYKSSLRMNEKYKLQVTWYCRLTWDKQWWILYLSKDKYIFDEVDSEEYIEVFKELLTYSRSIIKIDKNKNI